MTPARASTGLRVCALYPTLLNIYADRGNLMVLRDRCAWRGIAFSCAGAGIGEPIDPDAYNLYYIGGGQDRDQQLCSEDLVTTKRAALTESADRGALIVGICGGYQMLGHSYRTGATYARGLGLLDVETVSDPGERLIGNVAVEVRWGDDEPRLLAGFENHGGRTHLGQVAPLGRVVRGHGNNGSDHTEGAHGGPFGNVLGTYLHGPLLAKNPWLADRLIATALGTDPAALEPLDDALEEAGHLAACRAAGV
jgi:hypothetical protein